MRADGHDYEEDLTTEGKSNFFSVSEKWAYSSTGVFLGDENADYLASNKLGLNVSGPRYYQNARLSPLSLKYYGLCLRSGSYNVKLHFAEIMYSNDQTFSSLGKRIFDILIQVSMQPVYDTMIQYIVYKYGFNLCSKLPVFRIFRFGLDMNRRGSHIVPIEKL